MGVNWAGLESANAQATEGRSIPWLQDMDHDGDGSSDAWSHWGADHLDLVVLDGNNEVMGVTNLITYGLGTSGNHEAMRDALIDAAMVTQKPWHHAHEPLDIDGSGAVVPLDALMIINRLNSIGSEQLPPPVGNQPPPPYYDANGDDRDVRADESSGPATTGSRLHPNVRSFPRIDTSSLDLPHAPASQGIHTGKMPDLRDGSGSFEQFAPSGSVALR